MVIAVYALEADMMMEKVLTYFLFHYLYQEKEGNLVVREMEEIEAAEVYLCLVYRLEYS